MQIGEVSSDDLVQVVTLIICIAGIVFWLRWGRGRIGYAISPLIFLFHRALFYVIITIDHSIPNPIIVMWSSAISLHSVIVVTSAAIMMIAISRRGKFA